MTGQKAYPLRISAIKVSMVCNWAEKDRVYFHHLGSPCPSFSPGHRGLIAISKFSAFEFLGRGAVWASFGTMFMETSWIVGSMFSGPGCVQSGPSFLSLSKPKCTTHLQIHKKTITSTNHPVVASPAALVESLGSSLIVSTAGFTSSAAISASNSANSHNVEFSCESSESCFRFRFTSIAYAAL